VLDGLFVTPAVTAIGDALACLDHATRIAVVGNAKLASALAPGRTVIPIGLSTRAAAKLSKTPGIDPPLTHEQLATIEPGTLDALIGVDITEDDHWKATLHGWTRVVRDRGVVVLVDRNQAAEASRRALCAGITELEQRHAGRAVITSGLVTHL